VKILWGIAIAALGYLAAREVGLRIVGPAAVAAPTSEATKQR
jgi:hypothetical protein